MVSRSAGMEKQGWKVGRSNQARSWWCTKARRLCAIGLGPGYSAHCPYVEGRAQCLERSARPRHHSLDHQEVKTRRQEGVG